MSPSPPVGAGFADVDAAAVVAFVVAKVAVVDERNPIAHETATRENGKKGEREGGRAHKSKVVCANTAGARQQGRLQAHTDRRMAI